MSASYFEDPPISAIKLSASANREITVRISERDGQQLIVIRQHYPNASLNSSEQTFEVPAAALDQLKRALDALEESSCEKAQAGEEMNERSAVEFAHPSEEEFARILDFYRIAWKYEPRTFAVEWDNEGNFVSSFTPDFYLPDHDLYIELTTLKQNLVTAKNRKVRLLKQHYPDVRIKLLYRADYRKLIEKFAANGGWQRSEEEFVEI